jgi:hypothetical protein
MVSVLGTCLFDQVEDNIRSLAQVLVPNECVSATVRLKVDSGSIRSGQSPDLKLYEMLFSTKNLSKTILKFCRYR